MEMNQLLQQKTKQEPKHDLDCDCGICQYCNGTEDIYGNPTWPRALHNYERQVARLIEERDALRKGLDAATALIHTHKMGLCDRDSWLATRLLGELEPISMAYKAREILAKYPKHDATDKTT